MTERESQGDEQKYGAIDDFSTVARPLFPIPLMNIASLHSGKEADEDEK